MKGSNHSRHYMLWQTARSTSAAPTVFSAYEQALTQEYIDGSSRSIPQTWLDGGLKSNCPAPSAVEVAQFLKAVNDGLLAQNIDCIVGLGTGTGTHIHLAENTNSEIAWATRLMNVLTDSEEY